MPSIEVRTEEQLSLWEVSSRKCWTDFALMELLKQADLSAEDYVECWCYPCYWWKFNNRRSASAGRRSFGERRRTPNEIGQTKNKTDCLERALKRLKVMDCVDNTIFRVESVRVRLSPLNEWLAGEAENGRGWPSMNHTVW